MFEGFINKIAAFKPKKEERVKVACCSIFAVLNCPQLMGRKGKKKYETKKKSGFHTGQCSYQVRGVISARIISGNGGGWVSSVAVVISAEAWVRQPCAPLGRAVRR